jgi:heat shock protein HslJ
VWVLVSLNGNALIEGKAITLRFGDTAIEGSGGCNTYGGSYRASEDSLSLDGVYWTEMACVEPKGIMEQEQAYFQALNAAAGYRVAQDQGSGERLELYDKNGSPILEFIAAAALNPVQSNALSGTMWTLVSLNGSAPLADRAITLSFDQGSLEGSAGCNTYGGSYTASEESLSFGGVYATERACMEPAGIMEQERAYLDALNARARYQIPGDRLKVYDGAGTPILAFVASTSDALAEEEMSTRATSNLSPDCTLGMDETYPVGEPVNLRFELRNQTDRPLYVLVWYTPLEGMAGDIFEVTRDGEKLPYQGMLAKRGAPTREEYVAIEPGTAASAEVDLRIGYDLSRPGSYQVQFAAGLRDVTDDASLVPQEQGDHRPQAASCNVVRFSVLPTPEGPAGSERYVDTPSGVSLWLPESWTVVEPGPHGGPTML